ncbi:MAG: redoxin domain-containing protein [Prevotellaceae bacterium]|jgi:thiol-disulfide isomerase/thioredoxin|nr:redoxin domain-containing protein [Prevotellaceae bacterium]
MKIIVCITTFLLLSFTYGCAQESGYNIEVHIAGAEAGKTVILNQYVASASRILDSLSIDSNGDVRFTGENRLAPGMYNITVPTTLRYGTTIDFFISDGTPQHFSLSFDLQKGFSTLEIKDSPENELFAECMRYIDSLQQRGQALQEQIQLSAQRNPDSIAIIRGQLQQFAEVIKAKWMETQLLVPGSTLALFIKSVQEPEAPQPDIPWLLPNRDSLMQAYYINYYKEHFFDNIDFSDARILNMPILVNLLNLYTTRVLPRNKEVLIERSDFLINKAKANREVYEFIVRNRYDFFRSTTQPDLEKVAVHIAEKYIVEDSEQWTDIAYVSRMEYVVEQARLNPVGSKATNLTLQSPTGNYISINDIQAPYIVLYFYNPGCDLCAMLTPELWEIYQEYSREGLQVLAIYVDQNRDEWLPYITERNYSWINGWDPDRNEKLYEKYDLHAIPTIYLLDSNKTVILKDVTIEQLSEKLIQK